jgi:hypothetical protein
MGQAVIPRSEATWESHVAHIVQVFELPEIVTRSTLLKAGLLRPSQ